MKKRVVSVLLVFAMLVGLMPMAMAADGDVELFKHDNGAGGAKLTVTRNAAGNTVTVTPDVSGTVNIVAYVDGKKPSDLDTGGYGDLVTSVAGGTVYDGEANEIIHGTDFIMNTANSAAASVTFPVAAQGTWVIWANHNDNASVPKTMSVTLKDGKIVPDQSKLTFKLDGGKVGTSTDDVEVSVNAGETITIWGTGSVAPAPTKAGFILTGWSDGTDTYNASKATIQAAAKAGNIDLTAQWTAKTEPLAEHFEVTGTYTYNGRGQTPTVRAKSTVTGMGNITVKTTQTNANTYDVTIDVAEGANYAAKTGIVLSDAWTIGKAAPTLTADNVNAVYGDTNKAVVPTTNSDGAVTYSVKDGSSDVIEVAADGKLTIKKVGSKVVTVSVAEGTNHTAISKDVTVTVNPAAFTGTVTIAMTTDANDDGETNTGDTLTATATGTNTAFSYQWNRNGTPIAGATEQTYVVTADDMDQRITCTITPDDTTNYTGSKTSNPLDPGKVTLTGKPEITGEGEVGETLTLNKGTLPAELDAFDIQWKKDGEPIDGATGTTYEVKTEDQGAKISATVTPKADSSYTDSATSNEIEIAVIPAEKYTVTYTVDPAKGSSVASVTVEAGTEITLPAVTAKEGFRFVGWTLDGKAVSGEQTITGDTEFVATFEEVVEPDPEPHIAYINGRPDDDTGVNHFVPDAYLPRSEAAIILARVTPGFDKDTTYAAAKFEDLDGEYCANYVAFCVANDLIKGKTDTAFAPKDNVTRAEFATMLARMYYGGDEHVPADTCERFTDGTASGAYYEKYIAVLEDFITGYPDGSFRPGNEITRAEAVTMVNAVLGRGQSTKTTDPQLNVKSIFPDVTSGQWFFNNVMEATNAHDAKDEIYHK